MWAIVYKMEKYRSFLMKHVPQILQELDQIDEPVIFSGAQ
jgi:hypothetical protein